MQITEIFAQLQDTFDSGRTRSLRWRLSQLAALHQLLLRNRHTIEKALRADLGKAPIDSWITEISQVIAEIKHTRKQLADWIQPQRARTPLALQPARSSVHYEPRGVVLIIAPWNYPLQLLLNPLVGAIAAGNCAILKPSEVATNTEQLLAQLVPKYLDPHAIKIITGDAETTQELIAAQPDLVFFTGSTAVGRAIASQCAPLLIPTVLELGGKCPVYVHKDADLEITARRLVWAKFTNAGQTCVAPDYVCVHQAVAKKFTRLLTRELRRAYGKNPQRAKFYGRIITPAHTQRLAGLIDQIVPEQLLTGGAYDTAARYVAPTVALATADSALMREEIFGPIMPVLTVTNMQQAITTITGLPKPLAAYCFTGSKKQATRFFAAVPAGASVRNAAMLQLANPHLPFGGVGASGIGNYHGYWSFKAFSVERAHLDKSLAFDTVKLIAAPVSSLLQAVIRTLVLPGGKPQRAALQDAKRYRKKRG